jgi:hypothetical protein
MVHGSHRGSLAARRGDMSNPRLRSVAPPSQDGAARRQALPAEAAQARLFEDILRREIAEMMSGRPQSRAEQQARIAEVDRLIQALRHRFPRPAVPPTADRAPRASLN